MIFPGEVLTFGVDLRLQSLIAALSTG